jgi:Icc-related predicted phosphoesterase
MKPIIGGSYFLTKMLAKAEVDLFICGHIHAYSHFQVNGLNVLVSGGGGPGTSEPFPFHHYVAIRVRENSITQQLRLP